MIDYEYIIKIDRKDIDIMNKITEAYEGIGNIRTLSASEGLVKILTNKYFLNDVDLMLEKIRKVFKINVEVLSIKKWEGEI
ncbi:DUF4911 domain-containing protein [Oceanivirga miroungae]|uniref:DUF4911 domain-containing protein n=1 Tax=Oceanivirga miroungae TaxID=1130046 RepID=A0A6I8MD03_9FUSO|nr:DUF4911 domain-containing protein [Oceanivirga miroungae]VWL85320.1 hypothetical protein OMES3154_00604 [Oceanivirga miroungae]